jgi:hypothetical protein
LRSKSGEGFIDFAAPPHPAPGADLSPPGRGCHGYRFDLFKKVSVLYTALVNAPSMMRLVPEIRLATGLARNTTPAATSCAVPMRPVGFNDIAVL